MAAVARALGPTTAEGKRKVSQNARKHGFRAKIQILSPTQEAEIAETIQFFARDFPPQSASDRAVLVQLGKAFWTLKQFDNLEAQQYLNPDYEEAVRRLNTLTRYRAHHERLFHKAMKVLIQSRFCTNKLRPPLSNNGSSNIHPSTRSKIRIPENHLPPDDQSPATSTGALQTGDVFADRYEVVQQLGTGGTSAVYKVWDRLPKEMIALKIIDAAAAENPKMLDYFKRELSVARKLAHRNVVRIHDLGEHRGQFYISMEYIEGRTLAALLTQRKRLNVTQFLVIFDQLCDGLAYVHSRGVIHRDIKPQNIMADKDGTLKLMDFGLARSVSSRPTMGIAVGTPAYMSPEQIMGQPLTNASDIYSCGAMFFEMLTGTRPLAAMSWADRCTAKPPAFPPDVTGIPAEVISAIRKCMEPEAANRFQSVEDLVAATQRADQPKPQQTFADIVTEQPADLDKVFPLITKAVGVLLNLHQSGHTHADLAPNSLKVSDSGEVYIEITNASFVDGSVAIRYPKYASPDMSKGATSDIYSLGFIFYEILLGGKAFRIEFEEVLKQGIELSWLEWHAALAVKARPLNVVIPGFPGDISDALAMMIEKRPEQRFQSLSAVAKALRRTPQPAPARGAIFSPQPALQPLQQALPHLPPPSRAAGQPLPKAALAGGALVLALLLVLGLLWFNRTPEPKTEVAPPASAATTVQPIGEDLPKSVDTSTGSMMLIPDGEYVTGTPGKTLKLPSFYLDRTEVTNAVYRAFCEATQRPLPKNPVWDKKYLDKPNYPVLNISWADARDFAAWAGKRLPTEEEWEKAARGPEGRMYPWGNWSQGTAANLKGPEDGHPNAAPVGSFPYDESPFGILDMEGNVEEWSASDFGDGKKVVRGGGFTSAVEQATTATRRGENPELNLAGSSNVGFRCAAGPDAALKLKK